MRCLFCKAKLVESNMAETVPDDLGGYFYQEYYCFNCNTLFVCSSQSGDYVEEYLEVVEL